MTVEEVGAPVLDVADEWANYIEVWGSRTVPHRLRIDLALGLVPTMARFELVGGGPVTATIRFDESGCHLDVRAVSPGQPWLALLGLRFGDSPELGLAMYGPTLPFRHEMPIEFYSRLMAGYAG